jgi:hypothetical protein
MTYTYVESDCSINDWVEKSANAVIDFSWPETHDDGSLESASRNKNQYHQVKSSMQHQPNDPMMNDWSWYEPFIGQAIDGPSVLAVGAEYVFARTQNIDSCLADFLRSAEDPSMAPERSRAKPLCQMNMNLTCAIPHSRATRYRHYTSPHRLKRPQTSLILQMTHLTLIPNTTSRLLLDPC